jgi:hypothetical protein
MPTPTDLVTDLPADFEVFGQAVATSMADLLGGTTGQILAKNSNTDMDFVWVANDVGDITAVTAGTGITGGGTSGAVTVSFDQANFGGAQGAAGKNKAINAACEIAQRGTAAVTLTAASFGYPVDRFFAGRSSGTTGATAQQFSSTTLDGFKNAIRIQRTAGNTSTNDLYVGQSFESSNSIPFANKAIVVSFYARAGANYSPTSNALSVRFYTGTGTDQSGLGSAFTGSATPISQTATLTTSWQRFQYTATLASTATQMQFLAFCTPTGTAGAADNFDITGLQVELGAVATPFQTATGTIQGELAACQRYYLALAFADGNLIGSGMARSTTNSYMSPVAFPVLMRTTPSVSVSGATHFKCLNAGASAFRISSAVTPVVSGKTGVGVDEFSWTSGDLVAGNQAMVFSNSASCEMRASAEL